MIKKNHILDSLIICTLNSITMFIFSQRFVNEEVTPKWLGLMMCVGIAGVFICMSHSKIMFSKKQIFIILMCFFLFIFIRNWITFGFDLSLLVYFSSLLLLFLVLQQAVTVCPTKFLFGIVVSFVLALSLQGIFQYIGVFSSINRNFTVTGNFDNPVGFAAVLACSMPLCFIFFKSYIGMLE